MPEALINNEISHEDFMTIINEEGNYQESKEGIRTIKSKILNFKILKKINLIKEGKKWMNLLNAMLESNVILLIKVQKEYRKHKSKKLKNEK